MAWTEVKKSNLRLAQFPDNWKRQPAIRIGTTCISMNKAFLDTFSFKPRETVAIFIDSVSKAIGIKGDPTGCGYVIHQSSNQQKNGGAAITCKKVLTTFPEASGRIYCARMNQDMRFVEVSLTDENEMKD